jgi:hypothetical protein
MSTRLGRDRRVAVRLAVLRSGYTVTERHSIGAALLLTCVLLGIGLGVGYAFGQALVTGLNLVGLPLQ